MQISRSTAPARILRATVAAFLLTGIGACADSLRGVGGSPAAAADHADQLFDAFATRFNAVEIGPHYNIARVRLAESALVPSRIFNDTAIWVSRPSAGIRLLYVSGTLVDGHYHLDSRPLLNSPARPGDTRHTIALEQLASSGYRWDTRVDFALGAASADGIGNLILDLLKAPEGRSERELREDYRSTVPRAAAAFGRGFSVDSLRVTPGGAGTTTVAVTLGYHPELMRATYPLLAQYLDKYLGPARYRFTLSDPAGAVLFDIVGRDRQFTARYRLQQGKLTSLYGLPHPWPDSLVLTSDLSLKVKMFTVGYHGLVTDFVVSNTGHERAWTINARQEPKWDLPLITERLIRSPLHRPFDGAGSILRLAVRDSAGQQTVFSRRTRFDVQESPIVRFLGSLASHAIGDLDTRVEVEEDRFIREGFSALQADVRALGIHWRAADQK